MEKLVKRQKKEIESRRRIIEAALLLFAKKGFSGTGLRELAANADVNVAMISYFFGSKKGLLKELLDAFFSGYLAIAKKALAVDSSIDLRLRKFIKTTLDYFEANRPALLIALSEIPRDDPEIIEHKTRWARQMIAEIDQHLCQPIARQGGPIIAPQTLGPLLTSTLSARFLFAPILDQVNPEQAGTTNPETAEQIATALLHGLLPTGNPKT